MCFLGKEDDITRTFTMTSMLAVTPLIAVQKWRSWVWKDEVIHDNKKEPQQDATMVSITGICGGEGVGGGGAIDGGSGVFWF